MEISVADTTKGRHLPRSMPKHHLYHRPPCKRWRPPLQLVDIIALFQRSTPRLPRWKTALPRNRSDYALTIARKKNLPRRLQRSKQRPISRPNPISKTKAVRKIPFFAARAVLFIIDVTLCSGTATPHNEKKHARTNEVFSIRNAPSQAVAHDLLKPFESPLRLPCHRCRQCQGDWMV